MLRLLLFSLLLCGLVISKRKHRSRKSDNDDLGGDLVAAMRDDANLDLPADEEYEDLRAELLAYHTALAALANSSTPVEGTSYRRSMKSTPCWQHGGICVKAGLCNGVQFKSQIHGCRDKLHICCFEWNKFYIRDHRNHNIGNLAMPWSQHTEPGGKGVMILDPPNYTESKEVKRKKKRKNKLFPQGGRSGNNIPHLMVILTPD